MEEITAQLQKMITVVTSDGKTYTGVLSGVDSHSLNICLSGARDDSNSQQTLRQRQFCVADFQHREAFQLTSLSG